MTSSTLQSICYENGSLNILNQLLLPFETVWENISTIQATFDAIQSMKVRGAPAIAIVAILGVGVVLESSKFKDSNEAIQFIQESLAYVETSRPTAVNLHEACVRFSALVQSHTSIESVVSSYLLAAKQMLAKDLEDNHNIGKHGAEYILGLNSGSVRVLTHCNTGSLATSGWGTALGIIRDLQTSGRLEHAYCTETRPYNQGSRLTAFELVHEKIPSTLVCDSMVSMLFKEKKISAVVVGADRIAGNGDTANKIGTYQIAIAAAYHHVPFIVAAPLTSIDVQLPNGEAIEIEQRSGIEVVQSRGRLVSSTSSECVTIETAAPGIGIWNPAFDVTPACLITAIATEKGLLIKKNGSDVFAMSQLFDKSL